MMTMRKKSRVFTRIRVKVLDARMRWPLFVSLEEDVALMRQHWREQYGNHFWDNTNIDIDAPTDADFNWHTYSACYGGTVGKGAVFLFLCGWFGMWELWAGGVSDTEYMSRSGVFSYQEKFVKACSAFSNIKFTSIVDKGYRCVLAAW